MPMTTATISNLIGTLTSVFWLIAGMVSGGFFIKSIKKDPRQIANAVALLICIYGVIKGGYTLFAPNIYHEDGTMMVGSAEDNFFAISLLLIPMALVVGILLLINGFNLLRKERRTLAHALPLFFGAAWILWAVLRVVMFIKIEALVASQALFFLTNLLFDVAFYIPIMLVAFLLYSFVYALLPKSKPVDYLIILGSGLQGGLKPGRLLTNRLDKALAIYQQGRCHATLVVSGGQGKNELISEAQAMKNYLLSQKVPVGKILMEDKSRNTRQNLTFSKKILDNISGKQNYSALIVTSNYHVLRAAFLAKKVGLSAQGVGSKVAFYYLPAAFIREYLAVIFENKKLAVYYVSWTILVNVGYWIYTLVL